jgi:UDP-N-acetylglucosamine 1-carboxyvinyltransferase
VAAEGKTTISNAAREPHVRDLARALISMGANIKGAGTDRIVIEGGAPLGGAQHKVVADYLDAGTHAIAAAAAGGDVTVLDAPVGDLRSLILKLRHTGAQVEVTESSIRVRRDGPLSAVDLITWTHPGFATDLQPQFSTLMTQATGSSVVQEFLFENRFHYVPQLQALGASIEMSGDGRSIRVSGPTALRGAELAIPDIRAGAALLTAALCAEGVTRLSGVDHLDRGYEDLPGKLARLGARITHAAPPQE